MITYEQFLDFLRDKGMTDEEIAVILTAIEEDYSDGYLGALEANGYEEADRETYDEALEDTFNEYEPSQASWNQNYYDCGSYSFYVFDDYDDAEREATSQVEDFIDGAHFTSIVGWEDYVDESWFEDAMREMLESYAEEIADEGSSQFENRLVEECYERNLIDDDDFNEDEDGEIDYNDCRYDDYRLQEMLADDIYDDSMRYYRYASAWYRDEFGDSDFEDVVSNNSLIDVSGLAAYVVRSDGPENTLASYDRDERTQDIDGITYYLYRVD